MSHNYTSPGRYNITVLCSNRLGWNSNHTIASVDIPIGALNITSASQFPSVDSNTGFDITIQGAGTGSCFVIDFGDSHKLGYAVLPICESQFPGVEFTLLPNYTEPAVEIPLRVVNRYKVPSAYSVVFEASNSISKQSVQAKVFVLSDRCTHPSSRIKYIGQTLREATPIYRSVTFTLFTDNSIDCPAASGVSFEWQFLKLENITTELFQNVRNESGSSPDLEVAKRSLEYGIYKIGVTLTLVGTFGVSTTASGYIEIVKSPLVAKINGGSMLRRGFEAFIQMDGSLSNDPDVEPGEDKDLVFTWVCIDVTGKNVTAENAFNLLVNGSSPPKDMEGKCFQHAASRLKGQLPKVVMDSKYLKSSGKEIVEMVLIIFVRKDDRMANHSMLLEQVVGKPPSLSTE